MLNMAVGYKVRPSRRRVFKAAKIVFQNHAATIECTIRDLSQGGARLMVASAVGIPDFFELALPGEPMRPCRLIWRKAAQIGVAFQAPTL
jgi:PilZ domain